MSPVNKKEPINGFPCILKFPVHIGTIYKLTLISIFIIWVRGCHQKTHYEAETYLYLLQSSWLIVLGRDWKHVSCVNNKINEQSAFKITSISEAKYLWSGALANGKSARIWTHQMELHFHTFPLVKKAHVMTEFTWWGDW